MRKKWKYMRVLFTALCASALVGAPTTHAVGISVDETRVTEESKGVAGGQTLLPQNAEDETLPPQSLQDIMGLRILGLVPQLPLPKEISAKGILDIGQGTIVIASGGYTQGGQRVDHLLEYSINGRSGEHYMEVESGEHEITITDLSIDLESAGDKLPALRIHAGAKVTLTVSNGQGGSSLFRGSKYAAGIQVDPGGELIINGGGAISAIGGMGASGIGGDVGTPIGGSLSVAADAVQLTAYSDGDRKAINVRDMPTTSRILQGTLEAGTVDNEQAQVVTVENRNNKAERYDLTLPKGYASFAASTTANGGEYIAYLPADVADHKLLTTAEGISVYNLLPPNKTTFLSGLRSQVVTYKVELNANGGKLSTGATTKLIDVLYGGTVPKPDDPTKDSNNNPDGWYTNIEGTSAAWNFDSDTIVKDTTLYVKWKPTICHVTFVSKVETPGSFTKDYNYDDLIPEDMVDTITNGEKVQGGWYTNTVPSRKWNFGTDKVTQEYLTLTVVWLDRFAITFQSNTSDSVTDMPETTKQTQGMTFSKPPKDPKRKGYQFEGWYRDKDCKNAWDFTNDKVNAPLVLWAGWAVEECTVKFDPGTGATGGGEQVVGYNSAIPVPTGVVKAKREGVKPTAYSVEGWYTDVALKTKWDFDKPLISKVPTFTLYAKWHQDTCYVDFDANNGTPGDNSTVSVDYKNAVLAPTPLKTGHELTQWKRGTAIWDLQALVTEDITLTAQWSRLSYTLSFDMKGGLPVLANQKIPYETKVRQPAAPKKAGYIFGGWYSKDTYADDSKWDFAVNQMPGTPVTLYAKWIPIEYDIVYEGNGGTPVPNTEVQLQYDSHITAPTDIIKNHYDLDGWYTTADLTGAKWDFATQVVGDAGQELAEDITTTPPTGTLTLYAKWIPKTYQITFLAEDINKPDMPELDTPSKIQNVVYNHAVKAPKYPDPQNPWLGYTFLGWYSTQDALEDSRWGFEGDAAANLVDADTTLYAGWKQDEYYISYDYGDGIGPVKKNTIYHYGDEITDVPSSLTKEHYTFLGWYKDSTLAEDQKFVQADDTVKGDTTLYAKWLGDPYKLELQVAFEEGNADHKTPVRKEIDVHYGDILSLEVTDKHLEDETKARPGYTLDRWFKNTERTEKWGFGTEIIEMDTVLYADWSRDEYKLTFNTYEGDPNPIPQQTCWYEAKAEKPDPDPTRPHYIFDGWYKDIELDIPWDFEHELIYGHTTIHAKWIPEIYDLSFETNGGSKLEEQKIEYGTLIPMESLKTERIGYVIAGWHKDAALSLPFDPQKDLVDANMTLYAAWALEDYKVTFRIAQEDGSEPITEVDKKVYNYQNKIAKPTFKKPHKDLNGWYKDEAHQEEWLFKRDIVEGNMTLYAYWTDTEYTVQFATDGGTEIPELKMNWGEQIVAPKDPVREGSTFTGWFRDAGMQLAWDFKEDFVEGPTTIYAGWNTHSYTITFDADGGTPTPEAMTLAYGELIPKPEDPSKEGFTFNGWQPAATKRAALEPWNFETGTVTGDTALTAQWKANEVPGGEQGNPPEQEGAPAANPPTGAAGGTGTGTGTEDKDQAAALEQLKAAAAEIGKVLTGDKAPLALAIAGVMVSGVLLLVGVVKKIRSR